MYEDLQGWKMPEQHRDRQYSILEYTIQATTQFSQTGFGFDDSFSNILETTRISPNGDHNDHDNGGSSFEDGIDFHGISFSSSALFPESSTVEHCSPSSPASSEEQEQDRSSSTVDKSSPHHQQSLPLTAETCKKAESLKREHTIVERNYRSRLNSKIEALSQQLFDVPSNKRGVKPSKCLVISRAAERLEQLERMNASSRDEIERLKQEIAVLSHLLAVERGINK